MSDEQRARSFGGNAEGYERFRPGPPPEVLDWLLPEGADHVIDLGAGTGALTRHLVPRVGAVVAVEPDERMRAVLARTVSTATVVAGTAEAIPLADGGQDAVLASSSWHWVDPPRAIPEVARVLRRGGRLGVLWTGIDRDDPWGAELAGLLGRTPGDRRGHRELVLPEDAPFTAPEGRTHGFTIALSLEELVGMAGTFSQVIVLPEAERAERLGAVRDALAAHPRTGTGAPVRVPMASRLWRAERVAG